jgi:hypothetical protein
MKTMITMKTMKTMKTITNIKTMKTMKTMKQNYFLKAVGVFALLMMTSNQVSAQTTPGDAVNITKLNDSITVKVMDNRGTIKYLQSNNGITQITNKTEDVTTTTWQLGGTLTEDTYIDVAGKVYSLEGLDITTLNSSIDGDAAGYTLLVSNALTGEVETLLAKDLIEAGVTDDALTIDQSTPYTVPGTAGLTAVANRISVFRNGIKLRVTNDWSLATDDTTGVSTVIISDGMPLYSGDLINVQWIK